LDGKTEVGGYVNEGEDDEEDSDHLGECDNVERDGGANLLAPL